MLNQVLAHLSDAALLRDLARLVAQDRLTTAALLAHLAEVDDRRLYLPAGYPSMHAYCVEDLRLSEGAAFRRIRAARAARQFPVLYGALSEGRLHLAAISLLAPHLTAENVDELVEAASYRRKAEIEEFLARRFAVPEAVPVVRSCRAIPAGFVAQLVPGRVEDETSGGSEARHDELVPGRVEEEGSEAAPSPERFLLQLTLGKSTHAKLRYAQALLSHAVPDGDIARVLDRALDALIPQLEARKFGARSRRAGNGRPATPPARRRYVPAHVRREVWERDQGQCTFVGANGRRCGERRFLEYDHVDPVARGGVASPERMRLR